MSGLRKLRTEAGGLGVPGPEYSPCRGKSGDTCCSMSCKWSSWTRRTAVTGIAGLHGLVGQPT